MTRKKPNYTQFMRRPAPLELSPPSDTGTTARGTHPPPRRDPLSEEEIPWGEIIVEFGPDESMSLGQAAKAPEKPIRQPDLGQRPAPKEQAAELSSAGNPARTIIDYEEIEGLPYVEEPASVDSSPESWSVSELAFPEPGAPPLAFMAVAVVLLLAFISL